MRSKKKLQLRVISTILCLTFASTEARAAAFTAPTLADPMRLEVPAEHAVLSDLHPGSNGSFIIHIQDAHSNVSGQENIAEALRFVMDRYDVRLVLSEGGYGDCSLTPLKKIAPTNTWSRVARRFLITGQIQAEEYLNLTSDLPMKIVGIEDKALYEKGLDAYRLLTERREMSLKYLETVRRAVDKVQSKIYPRDIYEYERAKESRLLTQADFAALSVLANVHRVELDSYPQVVKLLDLQEDEKKIDFQAAEMEQAALAEALSEKGGESLETYLDRAKQSRSSRVAQYSFTQGLVDLAQAKGVDTSRYVELAAYHQYLKKFSRIDMEALALEMRLLEEAVYARSLDDADSKLLRSIDRYLSLLEAALRIRMTSAQYELWRANASEFTMEPIQAFLNRKLVEHGYADEIVPYEPILNDGRGAVEDFYASVKERDLAFLRNAEDALKREDAKIAVLISGGYHTAHLTELLRGKGYGYAVLMPHVAAGTSQKKYERLLLEDKSSAKATVKLENGSAVARKKTTTLDKDLEKIINRKSGTIRKSLAVLNGLGADGDLFQVAEAASPGSGARLSELFTDRAGLSEVLAARSMTPAGARMADGTFIQRSLDDGVSYEIRTVSDMTQASPEAAAKMWRQIGALFKWGSAYGSPTRFKDDPQAITFVAVAPGTSDVIGYAIVRLSDLHPEMGELSFVAVREDMRSKNIGTNLFYAALLEARRITQQRGRAIESLQVYYPTASAQASFYSDRVTELATMGLAASIDTQKPSLWTRLLPAALKPGTETRLSIPLADWREFRGRFLAETGFESWLSGLRGEPGVFPITERFAEWAEIAFAPTDAPALREELRSYSERAPADLDFLASAFDGLAQNAHDAMLERFTGAAIPADESPELSYELVFDQEGALRLTVRDNGVGMAEEVIRTIFDERFSTKPASSEDSPLLGGEGVALSSLMVSLRKRAQNEGAPFAMSVVTRKSDRPALAKFYSSEDPEPVIQTLSGDVRQGTTIELILFPSALKRPVAADRQILAGRWPGSGAAQGARLAIPEDAKNTGERSSLSILQADLQRFIGADFGIDEDSPSYSSVTIANSISARIDEQIAANDLEGYLDSIAQIRSIYRELAFDRPEISETASILLAREDADASRAYETLLGLASGTGRSFIRDVDAMLQGPLARLDQSLRSQQALESGFGARLADADAPGQGPAARRLAVEILAGTGGRSRLRLDSLPAGQAKAFLEHIRKNPELREHIVLFGGAVRDLLLGSEPSDIDYAVVGKVDGNQLSALKNIPGIQVPVESVGSYNDIYRIGRDLTVNRMGLTFVDEGDPVLLQEFSGRPFAGVEDLLAGRATLVGQSDDYNEDLWRTAPRIIEKMERYSLYPTPETRRELSAFFDVVQRSSDPEMIKAAASYRRIIGDSAQGSGARLAEQQPLDFEAQGESAAKSAAEAAVAALEVRYRAADTEVLRIENLIDNAGGRTRAYDADLRSAETARDEIAFELSEARGKLNMLDQGARLATNQPYRVELRRSAEDPDRWTAFSGKGAYDFTVTPVTSDVRGMMPSILRQARVLLAEFYSPEGLQKITDIIRSDSEEKAVVAILHRQQVVGFYEFDRAALRLPTLLVIPQYRGTGAVDVLFEDMKERMLGGSVETVIESNILRLSDRAERGLLKGTLAEQKKALGINSRVTLLQGARLSAEVPTDYDDAAERSSARSIAAAIDAFLETAGPQIEAISAYAPPSDLSERIGLVLPVVSEFVRWVQSQPRDGAGSYVLRTVASGEIASVDINNAASSMQMALQMLQRRTPSGNAYIDMMRDLRSDLSMIRRTGVMLRDLSQTAQATFVDVQGQTLVDMDAVSALDVPAARSYAKDLASKIRPLADEMTSILQRVRPADALDPAQREDLSRFESLVKLLDKTVRSEPMGDPDRETILRSITSGYIAGMRDAERVRDQDMMNPLHPPLGYTQLSLQAGSLRSDDLPLIRAGISRVAEVIGALEAFSASTASPELVRDPIGREYLLLENSRPRPDGTGSRLALAGTDLEERLISLKNPGGAPDTAKYYAIEYLQNADGLEVSTYAGWNLGGFQILQQAGVLILWQEAKTEGGETEQMALRTIPLRIVDIREITSAEYSSLRRSQRSASRVSDDSPTQPIPAPVVSPPVAPVRYEVMTREEAESFLRSYLSTLRQVGKTLFVNRSVLTNTQDRVIMSLVPSEADLTNGLAEGRFVAVRVFDPDGQPLDQIVEKAPFEMWMAAQGARMAEEAGIQVTFRPREIDTLLEMVGDKTAPGKDAVYVAVEKKLTPALRPIEDEIVRYAADEGLPEARLPELLSSLQLIFTHAAENAIDGHLQRARSDETFTAPLQLSFSFETTAEGFRVRMVSNGIYPSEAMTSADKSQAGDAYLGGVGMATANMIDPISMNLGGSYAVADRSDAVGSVSTLTVQKEGFRSFLQFNRPRGARLASLADQLQEELVGRSLPDRIVLDFDNTLAEAGNRPMSAEMAEVLYQLLKRGVDVDILTLRDEKNILDRSVALRTIMQAEPTSGEFRIIARSGAAVLKDLVRSRAAALDLREEAIDVPGGLVEDIRKAAELAGVPMMNALRTPLPEDPNNSDMNLYQLGPLRLYVPKSAEETPSAIVTFTDPERRTAFVEELIRLLGETISVKVSGRTSVVISLLNKKDYLEFLASRTPAGEILYAGDEAGRFGGDFEALQVEGILALNTGPREDVLPATVVQTDSSGVEVTLTALTQLLANAPDGARLAEVERPQWMAEAPAGQAPRAEAFDAKGEPSLYSQGSSRLAKPSTNTFALREDPNGVSILAKAYPFMKRARSTLFAFLIAGQAVLVTPANAENAVDLVMPDGRGAQTLDLTDAIEEDRLRGALGETAGFRSARMTGASRASQPREEFYLNTEAVIREMLDFVGETPIEYEGKKTVEFRVLTPKGFTGAQKAEIERWARTVERAMGGARIFVKFGTEDAPFLEEPGIDYKTRGPDGLLANHGIVYLGLMSKALIDAAAAANAGVGSTPEDAGSDGLSAAFGMMIFHATLQRLNVDFNAAPPEILERMWANLSESGSRLSGNYLNLMRRANNEQRLFSTYKKLMFRVAKVAWESALEMVRSAITATGISA